MKKPVTYLLVSIFLLVVTGCSPINNQNTKAKIQTEESTGEVSQYDEKIMTEPVDDTIITDGDAPVSNVDLALEENDSVTDDDQTSDSFEGVEVRTDSGNYVGQIDNNFVEIMISGVPEDLAARSFMLNEDLKTNFDSLDLNTGDTIKFEYYVNEDGQNVLITIQKI